MRIALPLLILTLAAPLRADDPIVPRDKPTAETGETKPRDSKKDAKTGDARPANLKKPAEPDKKGNDSLLDPEIQKELRNLIYGPDDKKKADDPLESAIRGMRSAKEKIAGKETGRSTRDVQQKVIEDLEKLIEQAKNQKPPPSGQSNSPKSNQDEKNQGPQKKPSGNEKKPQDDQSPREGSGGQTQESAKSRESSDQDRKAREEEAERARRRDFIKDVWGHLPPNLRQQLLNIADEKSVPRYDDLIRRYFESLAEEGTRDKQK